LHFGGFEKKKEADKQKTKKEIYDEIIQKSKKLKYEK
jgi:hypothetical protein